MVTLSKKEKEVNKCYDFVTKKGQFCQNRDCPLNKTALDRGRKKFYTETAKI